PPTTRIYALSLHDALPISESIELVVVTPERQLLREPVSETTLPGADGCLGVLPGHAPLITELGIGELTYRRKGATEAGHLAIIRDRKSTRLNSSHVSISYA